MKCISPHSAVLASALAVVLVTATLPVDAQAYSVSIPTADLAQGRTVVTARYGHPVTLSRPVSPGPERTEPMNVRATPASTDPDAVEAWQLVLAVMGLVGVRMWRTGKKTLPLLG